MEVYVTPKAELDFNSIIEYLEQKWGEKIVKEFIYKVDEILKLVKSFPSIGEVETNDIRGLKLTRQTRILYRIREEKIIVLSFFDTRQDPDKKL